MADVLYAATVLVAELEVRHSRPIAPTRRVALGEVFLPTDPAPGFGGILLAGIVGALVQEMDDDGRDRLDRLIDDLEHGRRIAQPRLRYRFQSDTVGLDRSRHQLEGSGERLALELDDHANAPPADPGARSTQPESCRSGPGRRFSGCCAAPPVGKATPMSDCWLI